MRRKCFGPGERCEPARPGLHGPTALAMLVLVGALVALPSAARSNEVEQGRELAQRMCAVCHMNEGQGEKRSAMEVPGFAAVANRRGQTIEGIVAWLRSVPPMMPDHRLSEDERTRLALFIMSLRR